MSENEKACCAPRRKGSGLTPNLDLCTQAAKPLSVSKDGMIRIEAGKYSIGFEGPVREITLDSYCLNQTAVSNAQFAEFIVATGYVTESETFG
jgi:formylglycine-generating enzyme required for sulfatase activity